MKESFTFIYFSSTFWHHDYSLGFGGGGRFFFWNIYTQICVEPKSDMYREGGPIKLNYM